MIIGRLEFSKYKFIGGVIMKCYSHDERHAVATCTSCGKFICKECNVEINGKSVCKSCIQNNNYTNKSLENLVSPSFAGKSAIILFLLSFFAPLGINYFSLGLKKKGMFFITIFIMYHMFVFSIFSNIHLVTLPISFLFILIFRVVTFKDCLEIKKQMDEGIEVEDSIDSIKEFFNSNEILIFLMYVVVGIAVFRFTNGWFIFFMVLCFVDFDSFFSSDDSNEEDEDKENKKCKKKKEMKHDLPKKYEKLTKELKDMAVEFEIKNDNLSGTNIEAQVKEISSIANKMVDFAEQNPCKVKDLSKFIKYYMPSTLHILNTYEEVIQLKNSPVALNHLDRSLQKIEKDISDLVKQDLNNEDVEARSQKIKNDIASLMKKGQDVDEPLRTMENTINNLVIAYRKQIDMLFEEKSFNIDSEVNDLNEALKKDGFID